jgi:hypothetical protein
LGSVSAQQIFDILPLVAYNDSERNFSGDKALVEKDELKTASYDPARQVEQIQKQLDMLDRRLDSVDSIVSAVAERVLKQPITLSITCSKCGHKIEIAIIGTEKPTR